MEKPNILRIPLEIQFCIFNYAIRSSSDQLATARSLYNTCRALRQSVEPEFRKYGFETLGPLKVLAAKLDEALALNVGGRLACEFSEEELQRIFPSPPLPFESTNVTTSTLFRLLERHSGIVRFTKGRSRHKRNLHHHGEQDSEVDPGVCDAYASLIRLCGQGSHHASRIGLFPERQRKFSALTSIWLSETANTEPSLKGKLNGDARSLNTGPEQMTESRYRLNFRAQVDIALLCICQLSKFICHVAAWYYDWETTDEEIQQGKYKLKWPREAGISNDFLSRENHPVVEVTRALIYETGAFDELLFGGSAVGVKQIDKILKEKVWQTNEELRVARLVWRHRMRVHEARKGKYPGLSPSHAVDELGMIVKEELPAAGCTHRVLLKPFEYISTLPYTFKWTEWNNLVKEEAEERDRVRYTLLNTAQHESPNGDEGNYAFGQKE